MIFESISAVAAAVLFAESLIEYPDEIALDVVVFTITKKSFQIYFLNLILLLILVQIILSPILIV